MAESIVQLPADGAGRKLRTRSRTVGANTVEELYLVKQGDAVVSFMGRGCTLRIPGRAAGNQKLSGLFNASGSAVIVRVNKVKVDLFSTVVKADVLLSVPILMLVRLTTLYTGGTAVTKAAIDTALTSSSSVTVGQDAQSEGVVATTPLASAMLDTLDALSAYRLMVTSVGWSADTGILLADSSIDPEAAVVLAAGEGLMVVANAATNPTGNPATDSWTITWDWDEYTVP